MNKLLLFITSLQCPMAGQRPPIPPSIYPGLLLTKASFARRNQARPAILFWACREVSEQTKHMKLSLLFNNRLLTRMYEIPGISFGPSRSP